MVTKADPSKLVSSFARQKKPDAQSRLSILSGDEAATPASEQGGPASVAGEATAAPSQVVQPADLRPSQQTSQNFLVGRQYEIPIELLVEGPDNPRVFYRATRVTEIGESLKEHGQKVALNVYVDGKGQLVVDDGRYRLRGAKQKGLTVLRCDIIPAPKDKVTAFLESRETNRQRNDQSVLDDAFKFRELIEQEAISQDELARRMKVEKGDASKLLAIAQLPESVVMTVLEEPSLVTKRFLYNLAVLRGITNDQEAHRVAIEAVERGLSARDLESRINSAKSGRKLRPRSDQFDLSVGSVKGYVKSFPNGRVTLSLEGLSADEQQSVVDRLRVILDGSQQGALG